jgi:serine phosphatase RsbU (regulator of sigma subunit)
MPPLAYAHALEVLRRGGDADLHRVLLAAVESVGGRDPVVYLVDFAHRELMPLPVSVSGPIPLEEEVTGTLAGRAFVTGKAVAAVRDDHVRVWVPLLEGTERTGVLAVSVSDASAEALHELELLGVFAGLAVSAIAGVSDIPHLRRRGRTMSLAATMQWELMPPLSAGTGRASIAGVLEPAYDIAGDGFDYAINGDEVHFALIDGMGHGVASSMLAGLAVGAYRHARREHAPLEQTHLEIEDAVMEQYAGEAFATGILARLSTVTGLLEWTTAGHPPPLLLRDRKIVAELGCEPSLPFGLGDRKPTLSQHALQPNDAILLYTDGVVEARTPTGEEFGLERLRDLVEREAASGQRAEELLRRVVRAVVDHRIGPLRDDATLLLVQWLGAGQLSVVPVPEQRLISADH